MISHQYVATVLCALGGMLCQMSIANAAIAHVRPNHQTQISMDDAVALVKHETHGHVLRARRATNQSCQIYQIRVLEAGRIENLQVNGCTGAVVH